ncbi:MAG: hypothetical protein ABI134_01485 [Byssovorax sp.]
MAEQDNWAVAAAAAIRAAGRVDAERATRVGAHRAEFRAPQSPERQPKIYFDVRPEGHALAPLARTASCAERERPSMPW